MTTLTFDEDDFTAYGHGITLRRAHVPTANGVSSYWMDRGRRDPQLFQQNNLPNSLRLQIVRWENWACRDTTQVGTGTSLFAAYGFTVLVSALLPAIHPAADWGYVVDPGTIDNKENKVPCIFIFMHTHGRRPPRAA